MNLFTLEIPPLYEDLIITYNRYYHIFYLEMVRMSNVMFSKYLDNFLSKLLEISRTGISEDYIRAAIGVVSLHNFGYKNFILLTETFDRLIPQIDIEYIKFTSWCAGQLIEHPNIEQIGFVQHLFDRSIRWVRKKGQRRARPLAAAYMIESLSKNAGSGVTIFSNHFQNTIWNLIAHNNLQVIHATIRTFSKFTKAIINYRRSELDSYFKFFDLFCTRLLTYESPLKKYAALSIYREMLISNPDYFIKNFYQLYQMFFDELSKSNQKLVMIAAYSTIARLANVNSKEFISYIGDEMLEQTGKVIKDFPKETVKTLCFLIKMTPNFMKSKMTVLKMISIDLIDKINNYQSAFKLLECMIKVFGPQGLPEFELVSKLLPMPITKEYKNFFIAYTNCPRTTKNTDIINQLPNEDNNISKTFVKSKSDLSLNSLDQEDHQNFNKNDQQITPLSSSTSYFNLSEQTSKPKIINDISPEKDMAISPSKLNLLSSSFATDFPTKLGKRLLKELRGESPVIVIELIAHLPSTAFVSQSLILRALNELTFSKYTEVRAAIPSAIYHLAETCKSIDKASIMHQLMEYAMFDHSAIVRCSVLRVFLEKSEKELADPKFFKFFQMLSNEDSQTARNLAFEIIAKIGKYNPMFFSSITRNSLLDYFFTLRHVTSIRQRARIIRTLPCLVKASLMTISTYSKAFMEISMKVLEDRPMKQTFENFLEEDANASNVIGILNSLTLIAPIQPELVSSYADKLIPLTCDLLLESNERKLTLSILTFFERIFTPPANTGIFRTFAPIIMSACTSAFVQAHSRKVKIAILRIFGAIGVISTYQMPQNKVCAPPSYIDPKITRQFFQPSRDNESSLSTNYKESITSNSTEGQHTQYYTTVVLKSLLRIIKDKKLKDYYFQTVQCFVLIFNKILMFMLRYFDDFMSRFIEILNDLTDNELSLYLPLLTEIVENSQNNIVPFLNQILVLIKGRFHFTIENINPDSLQTKIFELILALFDSARDNLSHHAAELICLLFGVMDTVKTISEPQSQKILNAFSKLCVYANDLLYLVIPQICDAIICEQTLDNVRIMSLNCLESITKSTDIFEYLGPIVRALIFGLEYREKEDNTISTFEENIDSKMNNDDIIDNFEFFNSSYNGHSRTRDSSMKLLYAIILTQGKKFLMNNEPLMNFLHQNCYETPELKRIITMVNQSNSRSQFQPILQINHIVEKEKATDIPFSDDAIIYRASPPIMGATRHLELWLRNFIHTIVSHSPSPAICACSNLVSSYTPLGSALFKPAFLSCWAKIKENGKYQICNSFVQLLISDENYESLANELIDLIVYMHQYGEPLPINPQIIIQVCLRYGIISYALKLTQDLIESSHSQPDYEIISNLIEIFAQANKWSDAMCIWERYKMKDKMSLDILTRLKLWNVAEPIFREQFEVNGDLNAFRGFAECLASQFKWKELLGYYPIFKEKLPREIQNIASEYIAQAAFQTHHWEILDEIIKQYSPKHSLKCSILHALSSINHNKYDKINYYINTGFENLASKPLTFWGDRHRVRTDTLLHCQQLMEILELMKWKKGENKNEIEKGWKQRLITAPNDFAIWYEILKNRIPLNANSSETLINLFSIRSGRNGIISLRTVFESIYPNFSLNNNNNENFEPSSLCNIIVAKMENQNKKAIKLMKEILPLIQEKDLSIKCCYFYVTWLLENDDSKEAYIESFKSLENVVHSLDFSAFKCHIPKYEPPDEKYGNNLLSKEVQKSLFNPSMLTSDILRKWSEINSALADLDPSHLIEYTTNAIDALTQCAMIDPSFPDVVLLLNLFFENAHLPQIFNSTAHSCIEKLQPKLLLQASPQLLIQLSHSTPSVANFVHDVCLQLLKDHFHSFIFSIIVLKYSKNTERANSAKKLYEEFRSLNPTAFEEVELIRLSLLRAAVTWPEKILQRITDAFDHLSVNRNDRMLASLQSILKMTKRPKCEMHECFLQQYDKMIMELENLIRAYNNASTSTSISNVSPFIEWCKSMQANISDYLKRIRIIQLSAISQSLSEKTHFILAVPGTYKPSKPIIHIDYFIGQFSVYLSKQQPKDIVIMGDNGIFYQYLLKGHEDLRLDERIMQFFSLINSLIKKSNNFGSFNGRQIEAMFVMPLSVSHGLVQWVSGTDTLRAVVEQYRKMQKREPLEEYIMLENLSYQSFDFLQTAHKYQIIETIFDSVPDTDIANVVWMKAKSAEEWMSQTTNFSISSAMMSVVGYIIGLGDRHPSNLLLDRNSGKLIHIDFGDCFERAAKRKFLPEVVPFRLTRMIVKAMGITGTDGLFKESFINMSTLLRENKRLLVLILSVFVHEPLIDPNTPNVNQSEMESLPIPHPERVLSKATTGSITDKGRVYMLDETEDDYLSSVEMRNRVNQKLSGTDFDTEKPLSVEEQAIKLIEIATDHYNLAMMYSGWCPFW